LDVEDAVGTDVSLTPSEAGYVLGRSPSAINKAVDTGVIRARRRRTGKLKQRLLGPAELRFLRIGDELQRDLTPAGRRRLYEAVRKLPPDAHLLELGRLVVDFHRIDDDLAARIARLATIRGAIEQRSGGHSVIRGTDVPLHLVAALAREQTLDEIIEDYPSLSREQVEAAVEYATAYPKRERPYPSRSFKRMRRPDPESVPRSTLPRHRVSGGNREGFLGPA
jgi:uncharacterized protein (DUF433 family)